MMYPYITLPDETLITHSHLHTESETPFIFVHFERPSKQNFFDSARCTLPSYKWTMRDGYTDEEIADFEQFLRDNAHIFYKYAKLRGMDVETVTRNILGKHKKAFEELAK